MKRIRVDVPFVTATDSFEAGRKYTVSDEVAKNAIAARQARTVKKWLQDEAAEEGYRIIGPGLRLKAD